jgi:hypothetical protein
MKTVKIASGLASGVLGLLLVCCASSPQGAASTPQPVVPGTQPEPGVPEEQAVADAEVVERIAGARCDRSQSCDQIGTGATYHDRTDCMNHMRTLVSQDLNEARCPAGMGEIGVSRCVKSLQLAECDMPGQVYSTTSHCRLNLMCLK